MATEPSLLIVKPGTLSIADRELLVRASIVVVEAEDPASVRFLKPNAEVSGSDMLMAALAALRDCGSISDARQQFTVTVANLLEASKP